MMGPPGLAGADGAIGATGVPGPPGFGVDGDDGASLPGPRGDPGTQWRFGYGAPPQLLGNDGDFYFDAATDYVYQRTGQTYNQIANLQGSPGAGTLWTSGPGLCAVGVGSDGDFYLDTFTANVYQRVNGIYEFIMTIIGPTNFNLAGVNRQTASYTLKLTDLGYVVEMNVATANNLTIPTGFPVNSVVRIVQYGAGQTTIVGASGVTLRSSGSKVKINGQYLGATIYSSTLDEWILQGDLA